MSKPFSLTSSATLPLSTLFVSLSNPTLSLCIGPSLSLSLSNFVHPVLSAFPQSLCLTQTHQHIHILNTHTHRETHMYKHPHTPTLTYTHCHIQHNKKSQNITTHTQRHQ